MNNTRFATAIHIMTLLAKMPGAWVSSDFLAGSININAVIVRKELSVLREAGLVESKKGKEGGSRISKKMDEIYISEIFQAINNSDVLGKKNNHPNPKCFVGKEINNNLNNLFTETNDLVIQFLSKKKLSEFAENFG
ncbi:Rrf2 family transcriptional regulator [Fulvivirga sediminis]|uniref:Rrf2 family transcriptional regulator n=1 Tax=Fulvivirga sediminis TaxID=2803949 RepID=A0A937JYU5_9BACT|nr:Rrf2 family transcriptional regulator [Fulvivirga sediminis]MBL3656019.1 Rrf2 family transcriptional regulator [Fulvivirga sediminis]